MYTTEFFENGHVNVALIILYSFTLIYFLFFIYGIYKIVYFLNKFRKWMRNNNT